MDIPADKSYEVTIDHLVRQYAHESGFRIPDETDEQYEDVPLEIKTDKPWGAYLTLTRTDKPEGTVVEKILIVRPTPNPIPDSWDVEGEFAKYLRQEARAIHTALSFQRHFLRQGERWEIISGEGLHLTSSDDTDDPAFDNVRAVKISAEASHNSVEHLGKTWHSVVNTGPDFLIIRETITCLAGYPHDETDIQRAHDLVSNRSGTNQNK